MTCRNRRFSILGPNRALRGLFVLGAMLCARQATAAWPSDPLVNLPVCTAANAQLSPAIASDGAGGAFIAWVDQRAGASAADVYANHVLANGALDPAWPVNGLAVCTAAGVQFNCRILVDGSGGAYVSWQDKRTGTSDVYVHHVLSSGLLDSAWPPSGLAVCTAVNDQVIPELASDGSHGVHVAWYDFRSGSNYDIYAQHVLAGGSVDPSWPPNGTAVCTVSGDQRNVKIVADGAGGAIAAWDDYRSGAQPNIYAQRILSSGAVDPAWPADGSLLCGATGSQFVPVLVGDGSGGALVAWTDVRGGTTSDVYATRVLASGVAAPAWPSDGRALCTAAGDQSAVTIVPSGLGDAIVAWMDKRDGVYLKIYAQRATGSDGGLWVVDGVRVSSGIGDQKNARVIADGSGGAIVTWYDGRADLGDIYAQHVLASGGIDPAWPLGGQALCTASLTQQEPQLLADGSGGAIVSWIDARSGTQDIYAQRVQANGQLGGTVVDVPAAAGLELALDPVRPNPSRGGPISIQFTLPNAADVSVQLIDLAGRRLAIRSLGRLGPGHHSVEFSPGGGIPAGLYFVHLQAGAQARSVRAAILQ